ncbi:hypothetical protein RvY_10409 [Ramazzottius varieornatus]|uniref:DNA2/NAM7 helicase-like C-terminal domain-containing protein n=1 Tax=Ramazzottius varieornatus TaxID=947166 RepID=A0A1D1VCQ0_RAMVA|nr:hypothetical protein RvY_10409 [Ramazzottius varieornatus]
MSARDPRYVSVLRKDYRSSPQIMSTSSAVLYDSEMTFSGRYEADNSPLPPLQFLQVDGIVKLRVLGGVASYVNVIEMRMVVQQVQSFYAAGLKPQEVGVFSPAVRQLQLIRDELVKINVPVPVIGHVDEFLGGEVIALVISCVQSYSEWAKEPEDVVGFIGHPELSNFAISRARRFVSIVGNLKFPHREDLFWRLFLRDSTRKGYLSLDMTLTMLDL